MGAAFLLYDHLLTLPAEVSYIWRRPKSFSSISFLVNRYLSFATRVLCAVFPLLSLEETRCSKLESFDQYTLVAIQFIVCCLLIVRTYALYERSRKMLALLIITALLCLGTDFWSLSGHHSFVLPITFGCSTGLSQETALYTAIDWELLVAFDALIFSLTVFKTYKSTWMLRHLTAMSGRPSLMVLMLRDGAIYFAAMAFANLSNILTFYLLAPELKGSLSTFASSISVTMMSRLMLNLHEGAHSGIMSSDTAVQAFVVGLGLQDEDVRASTNT